MPQGGTVHFFQTKRVFDPRAAIAQTIECVQPEILISALRWKGGRQDWSEFRRGLFKPNQGNAVFRNPSNLERVATKADPVIAPDLYRDGDTLYLDLYGGPFPRRMHDALTSQIPEEVRSGFAPCSPSVTIGPHDVFECAEHPDGHLFGHAWFSFCLFGYDSPHDWVRYRELVLCMREVMELKAHLEEIVGPLEQCVYWEL